MAKTSVASILRTPLKEPKVNYDFDEYGNGYLDSKDFALFCVQVKSIIDSIYRDTREAVWIADMKQALCDSEHKDWLADALDALKGIGSIEQVTEVSPIRYVPKKIPKVKKLNYMNRHSPKTEPKPDIESLYGTGNTYEKV